jgi:hypothetical protein
MQMFMKKDRGVARPMFIAVVEGTAVVIITH